MERSKSTVIPSIRMGEMSVAAAGEELRTLIGSCIGLVLFDRRQRIGGLAHIVLPSSNGRSDRPGKFADTAIPMLIAEMRKLADGELKLTAKMAGGASMLTTPATRHIGLQNIESCQEQLAELRIPILAKHCGGRQGRRMLLDTSNGNVVIEVVGQDPIDL